jgi:hypothetical protein
MPDPDPIQLIRQEQADNRADFAKKGESQKRKEALQQQFVGTYLGPNADQDVGVVQIEGSAQTVPCEVITNGAITEGDRVLVSFPKGSRIGFLTAMPS